MSNKAEETTHSSLEKIISKAITTALNTRYNWSLLLITAIIWAFTGGLFPYSSNNNFDMIKEVAGYIQYFSLPAIIYGLIRYNTKDALMPTKILRLGVVTYVLSLLMLITLKNFGLVFYFGLLVIKPLSIFSFLLLIQATWQLPVFNNN